MRHYNSGKTSKHSRIGCFSTKPVEMCPYPRRTASAQAQIEETSSSPSERVVLVKRKREWQKHINDCQAVRREAHSLKYLTRNVALILTLMIDVGNNRRSPDALIVFFWMIMSDILCVCGVWKLFGFCRVWFLARVTRREFKQTLSKLLISPVSLLLSFYF